MRKARPTHYRRNPVPRALRLRVAEIAGVSEDTVDRFLAGGELHPFTRRAIAEALRCQRGIARGDILTSTVTRHS